MWVLECLLSSAWSVMTVEWLGRRALSVLAADTLEMVLQNQWSLFHPPVTSMGLDQQCYNEFGSQLELSLHASCFCQRCVGQGFCFHRITRVEDRADPGCLLSDIRQSLGPPAAWSQHFASFFWRNYRKTTQASVQLLSPLDSSVGNFTGQQ